MVLEESDLRVIVLPVNVFTKGGGWIGNGIGGLGFESGCLAGRKGRRSVWRGVGRFGFKGDCLAGQCLCEGWRLDTSSLFLLEALLIFIAIFVLPTIISDDEKAQ